MSIFLQIYLILFSGKMLLGINKKNPKEKGKNKFICNYLL